jgi:hypothetical protein
LVDVYDCSAALLGGMLWLDWVYLEGRQFDSLVDVLGRIERFVSRLNQLGASRQGD